MASSSVSSASGGSPDLLAKYNKLAAEFAKLRAQLPVLKKAVIDEQTKNSELSEALQGKDLSVRKLEQEVDSLNFRNKQLEKRIGVLQNELAEITAKGHKNKKATKDPAAGQGEGSSSQLDFDLVSKIEENMRLQQQLSDLEQSSDFEIATLRSQLESLDNEETHKELILNELTSLKSEHQSLSFALQNSLDEIEAYREQVQQMKEKLASPTHVPNTNTATATAIHGDGEKSSSSKLVDKSHSNDSGLISADSEITEPPTDLLEKLRTSEQQKEYWTLEYQLLKMKYDRIIKKWEDCKDILRSLGREDLLQLGSSEVTTPVIEPSNLLGKMEIISEGDTNEDIISSSKSYEREIKAHMSQKINELVSLLQYADSRAVHFYNECKAMQSLLSISCEKTQTLTQDLDSHKNKESQLKEELDLTKGNYETQLTQLSEHLAIMNDKIAEKQELINDLQAKLKAKK